MPSFALGLTYVVGLLIAWLASRSYKSIQFNRKYRLPPRVAGIPFFGNTFQLPSLGAGEWAREQALKYGEMYGEPFERTQQPLDTWRPVDFLTPPLVLM